MGLEFDVVPADIDEDALTVEDPVQTATRLARDKALAVFERHSDALVIGGDTVVAVELDGAEVQLAKPVDRADAIRMLSILQGRTHRVITGVALRWPKGVRIFSEISEVTFHSISSAEVEAYVDAGESMDKAGAYAAQGKAAAIIASIRGSLDNVIGLPTEALSEALKEIR